MLVKPRQLIDREPEWVALERFVERRQSLAVVYGPRRVGKSFLLDALCTAVGGRRHQAITGVAATQLADFGRDEDPYGTLSDYSATIEWGDGHTTAGAIAETASGSHVWTVSGEHPYSPQDLGPHTVTVNVRDRGGAETRVTLTLVSYEYTSGGDFTIADSEVGARVSFWGARWASDNAPSMAPPSFKGWANSAATPPACGEQWSSLPGNSSSPPPTVPAYVAVLETAPVAKQANLIGGEASGLAVIHTDPGYAPNPGHSGEATVVAQVCP